MTTRVHGINYNLSLNREELFNFLGFDLNEFSDDGNSIRGSAICHDGDNPTGFTLYEDPPVWSCWTRGCHDKCGSDLIGLIASCREISRSKAIDLAKDFLSDKNNVTPVIEKKNKPVEDFFKSHKTQSKLSKKIYEKLTKDTTYLEKRGFSKSVLNKMNCGLSNFGSMDRRIVFPIKDVNGHPIGFTGRTVDEDESVKWRNTSFRKYINLLNIDLCDDFIKHKNLNKIIIAEGPLDVAKLCEAGYWNSVSVMGVKISDAQVDIIKKIGALGVILIMDNDKAGRNSEEKNISKLQRAMLDVQVKYPERSNSDVGDMSVVEIREMLRGIKWRI